jgi:hypothetical protein
MSTEREQVAIDLIYAALNSAVCGMTSRDAFIRKIAITLGIGVHLCHDNGIGEELAIKILQDRFAEFREMFQ